VPLEHEAVIVRRIFREFIGGKSQRQIARDLAREGVPTAQRKSWHQGTVSTILHSPLHVGRLRFHDDELEAQVEPIIDEETWSAAQAQLAATARTKGAGRGRPSSGSHLFTRGVLRCGRCGAAMVPRTIQPRSVNGKPYEAYLCHTRIRDKEACDQTPVARELVDGAALMYFERVCLDVEATAEQLRESAGSQQAEVSALAEQAEREVIRVRGSRELIERDYLAGVLPGEEYERLRAQLEEEKASAVAEATRLRERVAELSEEAIIGRLELEALEQLSELRAAIVESVRAADGISAVRAALLRVFDRFELVHVPTERAKLGDPGAELPAAELAERVAGAYGLSFGDYWLEPVARAEFVLGWNEADEWPLLRRIPLELAVNKDANGRPFVYEELVARIRALLRRCPPRSEVLDLGELVVDRRARRVLVRGREVDVSQKEYSLLVKLASDPDRVFTREHLLRDVWGYPGVSATRTVESHASRLRVKLGAAGLEGWVVNAWGVGYKLRPAFAACVSPG